MRTTQKTNVGTRKGTNTVTHTVAVTYTQNINTNTNINTNIDTIVVADGHKWSRMGGAVRHRTYQQQHGENQAQKPTVRTHASANMKLINHAHKNGGENIDTNARSTQKVTPKLQHNQTPTTIERTTCIKIGEKSKRKTNLEGTHKSKRAA